MIIYICVDYLFYIYIYSLHIHFLEIIIIIYQLNNTNVVITTSYTLHRYSNINQLLQIKSNLLLVTAQSNFLNKTKNYKLGNFLKYFLPAVINDGRFFKHFKQFFAQF